ncbi:MAG: phosphoesterase [Cyanobacteria bacterium M_DeepCast_200m_mx_001]|nr:phosphoesterase [Cyanobacteria bacterium M_DeepCast_200m_mx_001]
MARWALVSGLQGDLALYEAIQRDLRQLARVDTLFVLGDLIGPDRDANALLARLQDPRRGELAPQCIYGWWEEQLLAERGYRGERRADPLRQQFGQAAVEALEQAVDPGHLAWLAALQFGFIELDCALLHGSSAAVDDSLGPDSSPLLLLDRLTRMDVNRLFTARSGQQFRLELSGGGIESQVRDLEGQRQHQQSVPQRQVIGIGAGVRYTLYDPGSDRLDFLVAGSRPQQRARGFA